MVELEEVEDPELEAPQPGRIDDDDDSADYTDTGSFNRLLSRTPISSSCPSFHPPLTPFSADSSLSTNSLVSSALPSETISERILALRDMVSPSTRRHILSTASQLTELIKGGALWGGKGLWVLTASALMVGVPWAMAFVEEQQLMEMEREQRTRESTGEVRFSSFLRRMFDVRRAARGMMLTTSCDNSRFWLPAPRYRRQERKGERHSRSTIILIG